MVRKLIAIVLSLIDHDSAGGLHRGCRLRLPIPPYWAKLVHEENSLAASVLYLPYLVLGIAMAMY